MIGKNREMILIRRIRIWLSMFMVGLLLSGLTAMVLVAELRWMDSLIGQGTFMDRMWPAMAEWISHLHIGLVQVEQDYPFMLYGTDWLAFAHIVLAIAFIGAWKDPVKNVWVIQLGMIACILVIPLALIFGPIREIPFFWRLIDCSFGVFGIVPLALVYRWIKMIEIIGLKQN